MKKYKAAALIAAPVALFLTNAADAQNLSQKPISAEVGYGYLTNGSGDANRGGLHLGAGFLISKKNGSEPLNTRDSIDLDYNHNTGNGGHTDAYGVSLVRRMAISTKKGSTTIPYYGLGLGIFHNDVKVTTTTSTLSVPSIPPISQTSGITSHLGTTTTTTHSASSNQIGGKLILGLETTNGTYVEGSYNISGSAQGVRTDSINLSIGMRF